ncbi:MAG: hypothetical protein NT157_03300 [Candidatus Micrarchaeota archaeon]|nr:hypothetical protein [Candidatus Micrarchaeota archaeon]
MAGRGKKKERPEMRKPAKTDSPEVQIIRKAIEMKLFYWLAGAMFLLFLLTQSVFFMFMAGALLLALVVAESLLGVMTHGVTNEIKELAMAAIFALAVWYGGGFLLNTPAPLDAIVTCSMLPELQRGDFVLVQGADVNAREIEVGSLEFGNVTARVDGDEYVIDKPLWLYCPFDERNVPACEMLTREPGRVSETYGPLTFKYGICNRRIDDGQVVKEFCVKSVVVDGMEYGENLSSDVILYDPLPNDRGYSYRPIIHRVWLKIRNLGDGKTYYLVKGDNNNIFDLQNGNSLVAQERVHGKVLVRIPYLGYIKLLISGLVSEPAGCDRYFLR